MSRRISEEPAPKVARTPLEAQLFIQRHPCQCGERRGYELSDGAKLSIRRTNSGLAECYNWNCPGCQRPRAFRFALPERDLPITPDIQFGGTDPSQLLDAGEWFSIATEYAEPVERANRGRNLDLDSRRWLNVAAAALDEVLKFIPPGADAPEPQAFFTEEGRRIHRSEPASFQRSALEIRRDHYRQMVRDSARRNELVEALVARVKRHAATEDTGIILSPTALEEIRELLGGRSDFDLVGSYAAGWVYWLRYQLLPEGQGDKDFTAALRLFAAVRTKGPEIDRKGQLRLELPPPVRLLLEQQHGR